MNKIYISHPENEQISNISAVIRRKIQEKTGGKAEFTNNTGWDVNIRLCYDMTIPDEGYQISLVDGGVEIYSSSTRGFLYGAGRLMREADYSGGVFRIGSWQGLSVPSKKVRGMYFATHFYNYYHTAPINEIANYVEDIALWGLNTIAVWFDMHHFKGIEDPKAIEMIKRLKGIFNSAKNIGLNVALFFLGNEAYANSPEELRANWEPGVNGHYPDGLGSHYHVELCPYKPGASELMLKWKEEVLRQFMDMGIDYIGIGPYDQGGCTCKECYPWGGNGFIKVCRESSFLARKLFPDIKVIISAWLIEYFAKGEWVLLDKALSEDPSIADYIMWDYNTTCSTGPDYIMEPYIEQQGSPGGIPLIGFPEISMFATKPYGGWGSNPQIPYLENMWNKAGRIIHGGFPYSEGIYEDLNKAVCAQLYWNEDISAKEAAREYIASEFSRDMADDILKAVMMMQATYIRRVRDENYKFMDRNSPYGYKVRFIIQDTQNVEEIYNIMSKADKKLDADIRIAWRWRVLYLRSLLDHELLNNEFMINEKSEQYLNELETLYHAQKAATSCAPATRRARQVFRPQ